ncbi:helix-turn-helix domain-containing protein [Streptomyces sp. NPDC006129]|uniref:helix-turn-helix domain-containing protein n=1 Tax=Streptomyces sp. NPDC006129 TaxID=3155348 RepID=UPI0033A9FFE4
MKGLHVGNGAAVRETAVPSSVTQKASDLLEVFRHGRVLTLSEVARRAGLPKPPPRRASVPAGSAPGRRAHHPSLVTLGVIAAGVVALGSATALPADAATRYWTVQGTGSTPAEAKKAADARKSRSSAVLCCASTWTRKNTRRAGETCAGSRNTRFVGHGPAP